MVRSELPPIMCDLCGARVKKVLFDWGTTTVVRCEGCGLVFRKMAQELSQEELTAFMEEVGDPQKSPSVRYDAHYAEGDPRVALWRSFLDEMDRLNPGDGRRLLDIGAGRGAFLDVARKAGWEVTAVELSASNSAYIREAYAVPVFTGVMEDAGFPADQFDAVTMWDVIEHLKSPTTTLREVHRILKPGGLLVAYTPNHDSLIAVASRWLHGVSSRRFPLERLLYPVVHVSFFTPRTLTRLLRKTGFGVVRMGSGPLDPARCSDSVGPVRVAASALDLLGRPVGRGYRLGVIASKPVGRWEGK